MYGSEARWREVDAWFVERLTPEDDVLRCARTDGVPDAVRGIEVAANQGALLGLLARMTGARRVLEIGTAVGYSTIWLARALPADGELITLELDEASAALARRNLARADVPCRVEVRAGPALDALAGLVAAGAAPFDLVFIDADKPANPAYLRAALRLTRPGSVIVADNVVRDGAVVDAASTDERVQGVRAFVDLVHDEPRLQATALQTVGAKGWDGFLLALVVEPGR